MLDDYRIEPVSVGQYLDRVESEDIRVDQAVQRSFCWGREAMNALIYSALSRKIYIPNFILAEENRNDGTKQTYVVDAGQRTETLYQFKYGGYTISNNLRSYLVTYKKKKLDEDGNVLRDEYGSIQYELVDYDIRKKTYDDLPTELKKQFDGCPLTTVIYQDCTTEETSELVLLYNNHVGMNVSQKSLTYIGKFADEIKRIKDTNRFLMDCTSLSENEKKKGIWERVISESVMAVNYFEHWKKQPKDICDYLNNNASIEEFKKMEEYFNRLIPYTDKMENNEVAALFTSKNMFIWMMLFDKFVKMDIPDKYFGQFLNAFVDDLQYEKVCGEDWTMIDSDRHTKDRSLIERKIRYLECIMTKFLSSISFDKKTDDIEDFVAGCLAINVNTVREDMDFYEDTLNELENNTIKDGSKLLEPENHPSLLAMMVYSYIEDKDLDGWMEDYVSRNSTYIPDQRKNFLYMKQDFEQYCKLHRLSA